MNSIVISYHLKIYKELDVIIGMFQKGLSHFHIRKPDFTLHEYRSFIKNIPHEYHDKIVIHSHFELLDEFNLMGYYLSSDDRNKGTISQNEYIKSTFVDTFEELQEIDGQYDYCIIGSIFKSISKPDLSIKYNHDYLRTQLSKQHKTKILAIGGINESTTKMAINYGFDGVVILGAVWALYMETFNVNQAIEKYVSINTVELIMKN